MSKLSLLSIVVPTYNRHLFAIRQMEYWKDYPVSLYVLDGTDKSISNTIINRLPRNIIYCHMPCSVEERLNKGMDMVATPYAMMLGDDEFFIPSAILQCIDELEKDEELVSCMGLAAQFWYGPGNRVLGRDVYQRLKDYKVDQEISSERMVYHMNPYICSTIYSVMRSVQWKKNIALLTKKRYSSPVVSEIQFELGTCFQGKSKVINSLIWLRSAENPPTVAKGWDRKIDFLDWYNDPQYKNEHKEFCNSFVRYFALDNGAKISTSDVNEALLQHKKFLLARRNSGLFYKVKKIILMKTREVMLRISPKLTKWLRIMLNSLHYYLFSDRELVQFSSELALRHNYKVDVRAVEKIVKIISDFRIDTLSQS